MNNLRIAGLLFFGVLFSTMSFTSCDDEDTTTPIIELSLSEDEKADLIFMREEEKLARDVYLFLYNSYDLNIFNNIASSEQTHMDAVLTEMIKYGVADSASPDAGIFNNTELQDLYDALIIQGELSLIDALTVGATIEDVDIKDLIEAIASTSNADLISLYEKLTCGSRNHLRGFTDRLAEQGASYTPQFISTELYEEILAASHENCGG